jgi:hypothetical protein
MKDFEIVEFTGYYSGWDRCVGCGQRLEWKEKGKTLRHKALGNRWYGRTLTGYETHELVQRKRAEAHGMRLHSTD